MRCLELRSLCVSLKIIAHLRTFVSQSDSSIQRPRSIIYDKIQQIHPTFKTLSDQEKLSYLLGEHKNCCVFAAQYVSACHHRRENTQSALGPVSERKLSENSEYVNPEMRETLGFPFQNGRFVKPGKAG